MTVPSDAARKRAEAQIERDKEVAAQLQRDADSKKAAQDARIKQERVAKKVAKAVVRRAVSRKKR